MRRILLASALAFSPGVVLAQQCPVPGAPQQPVADTQVQPPRVPTPEEIRLPRLKPGQDGGSPALARLLASGAEVYDMGTHLGLRGVWAVSREEGMQQPFYIAPNGKGLIAGAAFLSEGPPEERNLTLSALKHVPGVIPSAEVKNAAQQQAVARAPQITNAMALQVMTDTTHGLVGNNRSPRVWMFFDPRCPYSLKAFEELRPEVEAGRLQLALIPVPLLDPNGNGPSTRAAKQLLGSEAPMDETWPLVRSGGSVPFDEDAADSRVRQNMQAARSIGVPASPTFVFADKEGKARTFSGSGGKETILSAMGR